MYRVLQSSALALVVALGMSSLACHGAAPESPSRDRSNNVELTGDKELQILFIGEEEDMPLDGLYIFSFDVKKASEEGTFVPVDVADLLKWLSAGLPRWYISAMKSAGEQEACAVSITLGKSRDVYLWQTLYPWVQSYWQLARGASPIAQQMRDMGFYTSPSESQRVRASEALQDALCDYVVNGDAVHAVGRMKAHVG